MLGIQTDGGEFTRAFGHGAELGVDDVFVDQLTVFDREDTVADDFGTGQAAYVRCENSIRAQFHSASPGSRTLSQRTNSSFTRSGRSSVERCPQFSRTASREFAIRSCISS